MTLPAQAGALEDLRLEAQALVRQAKYEQAAERLRQALALPDAPQGAAAELWLALADAQQRAALPREAMRSAERAWELRKLALGEAHEASLMALNAVLDNCAPAGEATRCEPLADAAVPRYEALPQRSDAGLAALLRSQALIKNQLGKPAAALPLLDRALQLWQREPARHGEQILSALTGKLVLLGNLGRYAEALAVLELMPALERAQLAERPDDVLASRRTRVLVLNNLGRLEQALHEAMDLQALHERLLGPGHAKTLELQLRLGRLQLETGRLRPALQGLERVAQGIAALNGAADPRSLQARYYHALALRRGGLLDESATALALLVQDELKAHGERGMDYVTFLAAHAQGQRLLGRQAEAMALFERAVQLHEQLRGPAHPQTWVARYNALLARPRAQASAADARRIGDALQQAFGSEHPSLLSARHLQAELLAREGAVAEALPLLSAVLASRSRLFGPEHPDSLRSAALLASLQARAGQDEAALQGYEALMPRVEALRRGLAALGPDAQGQVLAELQPWLAERVVLLARQGRLEQARVALEAGKARVLLDQLARQRALEGVDLRDGQTERLQRLAELRATLASRVGSTGQAALRAQLLAELRGVDERLDVALQQARRSDARFAGLLDIQPAAAADLRLLRPRQAMLHFLAGADEHWYAMLCGAAGELRWFELGAQPGLQERVEALRSRTATLGERRPGGLADYTALRLQLGERLLAPLLPALQAYQQLLISPDGALGLLPWDQLLVQGSAALQRWQISQLPSLAVLKLMQARRRPAPHNLLAFGAGAPWQEGEQRWPALPHAELEASRLAALYPDGRALLGERASEQALRELARDGSLQGYRRIAFAAHAQFDAEQPQAHALLLSRSGASAQTDGKLLVSDWLALPLRSELVLLSACDTARGQLLAGEGLIGFAYALQLAGNRDLLATLWPVSDGAAADFVPAFLARVKQGQDHAQALAATKRAFAASADPRHNSARVWAAFTLVGS